MDKKSETCNKKKVKLDDFDLFEDRTLSLLKRWHNFKSLHPEVSATECIKSCLLEINDDYTKALIRDK
jgi:hypothetical protein